MRVTCGGDGGNRTRVRKNRAPDFYERIRFFSYRRAVTCIRYRQPAAWAREPSFTRTTAFRAALQPCVA